MKKLFLTLLSLLSLLPAPAADIVANEGAWCWFADPRAIHYENAAGTINASYMGYIDVHGNVKATQVDFLRQVRTEVLVRSGFQPDDHNNPVFLVLPDERVMIFYTRHTDEPRIWYRISVNPGDLSQLGPEKSIAVANNTTYPSPFILSDDPAHIYLCWRGINWHPTMARLTLPDGNDEVQVDFGPKQLVQSTGTRPYCKYQSNGKDKIYLAYTTGHPDNEYPNWLYFNVIDIDHGNGPVLKDIKGNTLKRVADGTFAVSKTDGYASAYPYTVVDKGASVRNWVWQITLDADERPVIAYTHIDEAKTTHVYYYGKWTGSAWRDTWVQFGGHAFHQNWNATERCYSGGMALDPDDVGSLYLSIPTRNGAYDKDGVYEIWRYTVDENGTVTGSEQLTKGSRKNNVRPFVLPGSASSPLRLAWMNGDYYYWMVNRNYPKGYPTAIHCDFTLPRQVGDWALDAVTDLSSEQPLTAFSVVKTATFDAANYSGELVHADAFTLGLDAESHLYLTVGGQTYTSACVFMTSDDWATASGGTNGDTHLTKVQRALLSVTYDGQVLRLYRNELLELQVPVSAVTLKTVTQAEGVQVYRRALTQDEVGEVLLHNALQQLSIPMEVSADLVLPQTLAGQAVSWSSSDVAALSPEGFVHATAVEQTVTLTATVGTKTYDFIVKILPREKENNLLVQYDFEAGDVYTDGERQYVRDRSGHHRDLRVMGSAQIDGTLNLLGNAPTTFSANGYGLAPAGLLRGLRSYTVCFDAFVHNRGKLPRFYDFGSGSGNSFFLRLNSNNGFHWSAGSKCGGGTTLMVEAPTGMAADTWTHVAVTFNAADHVMTIYVDGQQMAQGTTVTYEPCQLVSDDNDTRNYIGRTQWWDSNTDNGDLVGRIDNFRVYNLALTADELEEVMVQTALRSLVAGGATAAPCYNLRGQRVGASYKGVVVSRGQKRLQ